MNLSLLNSKLDMLTLAKLVLKIRHFFFAKVIYETCRRLHEYDLARFQVMGEDVLANISHNNLQFMLYEYQKL